MNCVCTGSLRLKLVTWKLIKNSLKISAKNFSYYADYAENIAEPTTFCFDGGAESYSLSEFFFWPGVRLEKR